MIFKPPFTYKILARTNLRKTRRTTNATPNSKPLDSGPTTQVSKEQATTAATEASPPETPTTRHVRIVIFFPGVFRSSNSAPTPSTTNPSNRVPNRTLLSKNSGLMVPCGSCSIRPTDKTKDPTKSQNKNGGRRWESNPPSDIFQYASSVLKTEAGTSLATPTIYTLTGFRFSQQTETVFSTKTYSKRWASKTTSRRRSDVEPTKRHLSIVVNIGLHRF